VSTPSPVVDLMAALKRSLAQEHPRRSKHRASAFIDDKNRQFF